MTAIIQSFKPAMQPEIGSSIYSQLQKPEYSITSYQKILSACTGSLLTSILVTPFDVVKTRIQSQGHLPCTSEVVLSPKTYVPIQGTLNGMATLLRNEGVPGLWKGFGPTLLMSVPSTVIYYLGYEHLRDILSLSLPEQYSSTGSPLIAGAVARVTAATIISPIELMRTRMQSGAFGNRLRDVFSSVYSKTRQCGISILWKGLGPTLWRDVPFSGIYWASYESSRKYLSSHPSFSDNFFLTSFVCGASSGLLASVLTTPFDVAKTRSQVLCQTTTDPSTLRIVLNIWKTEGALALFSGLTARVSKVAPACAIMISSYEIGKWFFHVKNTSDSGEQMGRLI